LPPFLWSLFTLSHLLDSVSSGSALLKIYQR
jgi:hypothetical protein